MQATGGLSLGGITITPPPPPTFFNFGGAYITNAPQTDSTFGDQTAINSDGTVLVAAAGNINKVYVYSRSGTTWTLQQTLTGTGYFGICVSLSSDGCNLFVGNQSGGGKIYNRANTGSSFSNVFSTTANRVDLLKISHDGTAFVFPKADNTNLLQMGLKTGGTWSEICTVSYPVIASGNLPLVTMNSDGTRIAAAKMHDTTSALIGAGRVYIYSWGRTGTAPSLIQTITEPTPVANNYFGSNIDMSPDGNTLIIGSYYDYNVSTSAYKGAAYVYTWNGSQYTLQQTITGVSGDNLGGSSALGGDILILTKNTTPNQYVVYTRSGSTWAAQQTTALPTGFTRVRLDAGSGGYGNRSSLSSDGKHFIAVEPIGTSRFVYNYQGG